jgi:hypothetical protein
LPKLTLPLTDYKASANWNRDRSALRRRPTTGICSPKSAVRIRRIDFRFQAGQKPQALYPPEPSPARNIRRPGISRPHLPPSVDSSTFRWSVSSAASPGPFRTPNFNPENTRPTALRHSSFQFDDNSSHRGSYDQSMFLNDDFSTEESQQMKDLNLNDRDAFPLGAKPGLKRRASSPHRDSLLREDRSSVSSAPGGGDLYTRRSLQQYPNRNPSISASRYAPSHHGSISSASSYNPRNGSLASSYTLSVSSSATSYASGRISPGMMSPAILDPELGAMGYMNAKPLSNQSPGPQQIMPPYTRTMSDTPIHNTLHTPVDSAPPSRHNSLPGVQGIFICDCCPKKPKKFTSEDDLRLVLSNRRGLSKRLLTVYNQSPSHGKAILLPLLSKSVQKQERSRATPEFSTFTPSLMVVCSS